MKWYYLSFDAHQIFTQSDQSFIKDFIHFLHKNKNPEELGLYKLRFNLEDRSVFYLSTPDKLDYEVKKLLAPYPVEISNNPNQKVLELLYGK